MDRADDPIGLGSSLRMSESPDLILDPGKQHYGMHKTTMKDLEGLDKLHPPAPKRFKSSFIFFSMEKHREIKEKLAHDDNAKSINITNMVADAWRNISPEEKAKYEEMARADKVRYDEERATYKKTRGNLPTKKKTRDPDAPKRPMSAYLSFANSLRAEVKGQNPECSNGEISKILSQKWKDAADDVKQKYRDEETAKWDKYRENMVEYKKKNDGRKRAMKALQAANNGGRKGKKRMRGFDEDPAMGDDAFDDTQFSTFGPTGLDQSNLNQDDIMAASVALRGVRTGPSSNPASLGGMGQPGIMFDGSLQQGGGGFGALYGMNSVAPISQYGVNPLPNPTHMNTVTYGQDMGVATSRSLVELNFPYQQYSGYSSGAIGNPQAMIMAQSALRGNPGGYLGLPVADQQPPLSQLASLAGTQNGHGGIGLGGTTGMMNDSSNSGMLNY